MLFKYFSELRALTEAKVAPYGKILDNALLRHVFLAQKGAQQESDMWQ